MNLNEQPLGPKDVKLIQSLVSDFCKVSKVQPKGSEAAQAARDLLRWVQAGERDAVRVRERFYSRSN